MGFSPVHLALLFLLLLGPNPLRRGSWFVGAWLATSILTVTLLVTLGHGLLLGMEKGSVHRTGLDLLGAGALLALGLRELLGRSAAGDQPPSWTAHLDRFCALPLPVLLGLSSALQVVSPEVLFLYARTAGSLLAAGLDHHPGDPGHPALFGGQHPAAGGALRRRDRAGQRAGAARCCSGPRPGCSSAES